MTEKEGLLAAVIAAPEDDLPRLVLADWMDENGEGDRAEFIRLGCELARAKTKKARKPLERKMKEFMAGAVALRLYPWFNQVLDEWKLELMVDGWKYVVGGSYCQAVTFRRGFIESVRCAMSTWHGRLCGQCRYTKPLDKPPGDPTCPKCRGVGPLIVAEHPVEHVTLDDKEPYGGSGIGYTGRRGWQRESLVLQVHGRQSLLHFSHRYSIPDDLFDEMSVAPDHSWFEESPRETLRLANKAISKACIANARKRAKNLSLQPV